jgi:hypothetical protein
MYNEWTVELKAMADRIISMRQQLFDALSARGLHIHVILYILFSCLVLTLAYGLNGWARKLVSIVPFKLIS